jgi:outer membrane receptor protein involved in Fe transport
MLKFIQLLFLIPLLTVSSAQTDSSLLILPERLQSKDILRIDRHAKRKLVTCATGTETLLKDLPFTVWTISSEEILDNGYITLCDVLRAAPGIRVSQPGNAVEGETFLMRGNNGNQYVKILINNVPIKSIIAQGIGIGAQLPIRQAERIEILYGPAASLYGDETCTGVVNIILKETERPVFTQADLNFGRYGHNNLDLMFGGKLGKDKNVFRYSIFGSSTIRENTDLFYDDSLYNLKNYLPIGLTESTYLENPNFIPVDKDVSIPKIGAATHQSRLFGLDLNWRGLQFNYLRMYRSDLYALGKNPLAISWANPSDNLNEKSEAFVLGFTQNKKRTFSRTNLSVLTYSIENTSTARYIFDQYSQENYFVLAPKITNADEQAAALQQMVQRFASAERYSIARGLQIRLESNQSWTIPFNIKLETGFHLGLGAGTPLHSHTSIPLETNVVGEILTDRVFRPFKPVSGARIETGALTQIQWNYRKLLLLGGASFSNATRFEDNGSARLFPLPNIAPRLAIRYHLDSAATIYANLSSGFRRPTPYHVATTTAYETISGTAGAAANRTNFPENWFQKSEKFSNTELGFRHMRPNMLANISCFYQTANNLVRPNQQTQWQDSTNNKAYLFTGFNNIAGKGQELVGIQGMIIGNFNALNISVKNKKGSTHNIPIKTNNSLFIQYARGKEWHAGTIPLHDVFNSPRWLIQFQTTWNIKRTQVFLAASTLSKTKSKNILTTQKYPRIATIDYNPGFTTFDTGIRYHADNHFVVYFHVRNVFDNHFAGLDAHGTTEDLQYNPQQGRIWRLGVNYNMN